MRYAHCARAELAFRHRKLGVPNDALQSVLLCLWSPTIFAKDDVCHTTADPHAFSVKDKRASGRALTVTVPSIVSFSTPHAHAPILCMHSDLSTAFPAFPPSPRPSTSPYDHSPPSLLVFRLLPRSLLLRPPYRYPSASSLLLLLSLPPHSPHPLPSRLSHLSRSPSPPPPRASRPPSSLLPFPPPVPSLPPSLYSTVLPIVAPHPSHTPLPSPPLAPSPPPPGCAAARCARAHAAASPCS
ncbi:hypothetical protein C8R47DRAFT_1224609 [Mycena vitilis]|nr:hypothetical protein C8R47DRAFT_1224609 [Mycena vitilis]